MSPFTPWAAHPEFALYELQQVETFPRRTPGIVVFIERERGVETILHVDFVHCIKQCSDGLYCEAWQRDNPTHLAVIAFDQKRMELDFREMVNRAKVYQHSLLSLSKIA